jgi:predicted PurR-regulated permease PerM
MGLLYATSLTLFGVQNGFGIGMLAGLLNVVPYVGIATGFILSVSFSFLVFTSWTPLIGSVITFTALPMVDNFFVTPRILGKSVGMNPVLVVVSLLVGGKLLGILGMIIAVPAAAILKVLIKEALAFYHSSELYLGAPPPQS